MRPYPIETLNPSSLFPLQGAAGSGAVGRDARIRAVLAPRNAQISPELIRNFHLFERHRERLGLAPSDETRAYVQVLVPRNLESQLPGFLEALEREAPRLGVTDIQIALAQLEEVFLSVALKARICSIQSALFKRQLNQLPHVWVSLRSELLAESPIMQASSLAVRHAHGGVCIKHSKLVHT